MHLRALVCRFFRGHRPELQPVGGSNPVLLVRTGRCSTCGAVLPPA